MTTTTFARSFSLIVWLRSESHAKALKQESVLCDFAPLREIVPRLYQGVVIRSRPRQRGQGLAGAGRLAADEAFRRTTRHQRRGGTPPRFARSRLQQSADRKVFVEPRPMNTVPAGRELQIASLHLRSRRQPGRTPLPRDWDAAIGEDEHQGPGGCFNGARSPRFSLSSHRLLQNGRATARQSNQNVRK